MDLIVTSMMFFLSFKMIMLDSSSSSKRHKLLPWVGRVMRQTSCLSLTNHSLLSFMTHATLDQKGKGKHHGSTPLFITNIILLLIHNVHSCGALVLCAPVGQRHAVLCWSLGLLGGVPDAASGDFHYNTLHGILAPVAKFYSRCSSWPSWQAIIELTYSLIITLQQVLKAVFESSHQVGHL